MEFKDITFGYSGDELILSNLNFKIEQGKFIAIAGPNGSGKTTLIKHLNGLHKPKSGEVIFKGEKVKDFKELTSHVGIVFQNPDEQVFFPNVEDDIAFGLRNIGIEESEIEKRVNNVLKTLRLSKLRKRSFFNLSFGEKKKVAFAGVLVTSPDIMVLDEPTIGLDPWSKTDFLDLMLEMKKRSTLIVATHDFDVLKIVDRILMMWEGKIIGDYNDFDTFKKNMDNIKLNDE